MLESGEGRPKSTLNLTYFFYLGRCVLGEAGELILHESVLALVLQEGMVEDRGPILHESGLDLVLQEGMVEDRDPL